jgi:aspartate racemase
MHRVAPAIAAAVSVPFLHIADVVAEAALHVEAIVQAGLAPAPLS